MVNRTAASYRDADGVWHTLEVRNTADGWQVVDHDDAQERVIETLTGVGDGRPQADAVARDYLTTVGSCGADSEAAAVAGTGRR
jgi:hypothetical protein